VTDPASGSRRARREPGVEHGVHTISADMIPVAGRLVLALALLAGAAPAAGCGSPPPDLFAVERSGPGANADVALVVSDGGSVTCDGDRHDLDADRLLAARQLVRDLAPQAELGIELPPGPGTELSYRVATEAGTVEFSDSSRGLPRTFLRVAAFTADVTEHVCGIQH